MVKKEEIKTVKMKHIETDRILLVNHFDVEDAAKNGFEVYEEAEKDPEKDPEKTPGKDENPPKDAKSTNGLRGGAKE